MRLADGGQRMVAGGRDGGGQAREDAGAMVLDQGGLAVHQFGGVRHSSAVGLRQRLVAQADAQHGLVCCCRTT